MCNDEILFLVKFGERDHLQQLADGIIYFSNAMSFIKLEEEQQKKGQGDSYEGRMFLPVVNMQIRNPEKDELIMTIPNVNLNMGFEGLETMPLFCITAGATDDCNEWISNKDYSIKLSDEKELTIREHFGAADSALVIIEPLMFIHNVKAAFSHECISDMVRYYNMSVLTTDRLSYLLGCGEKLLSGTSFAMTTDNIYKHLFCKDNYFKLQSEYRFVVPKLIMEKPILIDLKIKVPSILVDIDEFFSGLRVCKSI